MPPLVGRAGRQSSYCGPLALHPFTPFSSTTLDFLLATLDRQRSQAHQPSYGCCWTVSYFRRPKRIVYHLSACHELKRLPHQRYSPLWLLVRWRTSTRPWRPWHGKWGSLRPSRRTRAPRRAALSAPIPEVLAAPAGRAVTHVAAPQSS